MNQNQSPFSTSSEPRSPFPDASLPQAGESLSETALFLFIEKITGNLIIAVTLAGVAIIELSMRWGGHPMSPWVWAIAAVGFVAAAGYRWITLKSQFHQLRLGIRGERHVGRMLEELHAIGYTVFHDIPGDGFNIDHTLIGPGGVFAIETKTISLPPKGRATIVYDGERVLINGNTPDRDPIAQVSAASHHLRDILQRMTDHKVDVRPVVVYPKWWIETRVSNPRVWVLNEKRLFSYLRNEPQRLSPEDVALYTERLTLHLTKP